ncbi:MAG TPA: preprotein translocase subunit YajC [Tepidisphaeraceae bacterium]|jgi:preprotein translocase subunit YajC
MTFSPFILADADSSTTAPTTVAPVTATPSTTASGTAAPGAASTQPAKQAPPGILQFVPILLIVAIFYLFVFKNKKGQTKKRESMLEQLKKNDEIQTIGGIIGKVVDVRDDRVLVKVDETTNAKMWFTRNAIHRVLGDDKTETSK